MRALNQKIACDEQIEARAGRLRLKIVDRVSDAADAWNALSDAPCSAYQGRNFLELWIEHVASVTDVLPRLGVVYDGSSRPIALLPFGIVRRGPMRIVIYLGGRDSNLNMPIVARDVTITPTEMRTLLQAFALAVIPRVDAFVLANNVQTWNGAANPLSFADSTPSPSSVPATTFGSDADAFFAARDSRDAAKKLRNKTRRLEKIGPISLVRAERSEAPELMAILLQQKHAQLSERGIHAGLDHPCIGAFLAALATYPATAPVLDIYVLRVGEIPAALFAGLPCGAHWHGLMTSHTTDAEMSRCSPGDLLLRAVIKDLVRRGMTGFDLGIGEARYKAALCDETVELVDTIVPLTPLGRLYATAEKLRLNAKRRIKQTPWAMNAVRRMQRLQARS